LPNQFTVLDSVRTDWLARHIAIDQKTKNIYLVSGRTFTASRGRNSSSRQKLHSESTSRESKIIRDAAKGR